MNELGVLLFLSNNPSAKTASDIIRIKRATKSHVSLAVKELTKKGYLTQHPEKGRNIRLEVTPRAEPLVAVGRQKQRDFLNQICRGFSDTEIAALKTCFERIAANLEQKNTNEDHTGRSCASRIQRYQ
ncbi:MarR family winged helix-turn-helix transcriptional regulator [[Clostridium] symbiosum]|nr:winged helix DNA-binding protein [[Clostridium] symbiosum]MDM8135726.1 winged helix DNA-binding protein [[Clostridium] symbiosum]MDM8140107.1 winged helix DNA-binding protein [[Clostridium] symbiosum]MDM8319985.1 winged helix DNA-binding protein [[Clostridium] symbiosum]